MRNNEWLDEIERNFSKFLNDLDITACEVSNIAENAVNEVTDLTQSTISESEHQLHILTSNVKEAIEDFSKELESSISNFPSEFIKYASVELRNSYETLGISQEIDYLYEELNISSDEELLEIICIFIAAGVSISLVIYIISYLESGVLLVEFSFIPFLEEYNRLSNLEEYRLQQLNFLLSEIEKHKSLNIWYQERLRVTRSGSNQLFIERQFVNGDHRQLSVSDNMVFPFLLAYLDKLFDLTKSLFNGDINMNEFTQNGIFGVGNAKKILLTEQSKIAGVINESQNKNLVEAAAEIQSLLEQLETSYPADNTSNKMTIATEAIKHIDRDPKLTSKILRALKAGSVSAFEQLLNHPAASFFIGALDDWQQNH